MKLTDLDFAYPKDLVALEPSRPTRVAWSASREAPRELNISGLINEFKAGDLLVVNNSKVIPARVFSHDEVEVLFLREQSELEWEVLFPARDFALGDELRLPQGLTLKLVRKGLPQIVGLSHRLTADYLEQHGEVALPPYIQEARGQRHNRAEDREWYQTHWATALGSIAAPTASLHFQASDFAALKTRGVQICEVTLHVGAGTFLPVRSEDLSQHQMHAEEVFVPGPVSAAILHTRRSGGRVWALGTTVARTLESLAAGTLVAQQDGSFFGSTKLFIYPPYEFKAVDVLLTNFHQPKSTLLALVSAFAGAERAREVYAWAIERRFQLFSYGDLSAWTK